MTADTDHLPDVGAAPEKPAPLPLPVSDTKNEWITWRTRWRAFSLMGVLSFGWFFPALAATGTWSSAFRGYYLCSLFTILPAGIVGACSQSCYWRARSPGGLKGWRQGLIAGPLTFFWWWLVETCQAVMEFTDRGSPERRRTVIGLVLALTLSPVLVSLWGLFYGMTANALNRRAWRRETVPVARGKWRLQMFLVIALQIAGLIGLIWVLWQLEGII